MDTSTYRTKLEEEKGRLEEELRSVGRKNPSNPADWEPVPDEVGQESDILDAGSLITDFETNTAVLKDLEIRYNEVLAALKRMDEGTYGVCAVGGEEIELERLTADPAAKTCKAHIDE